MRCHLETLFGLIVSIGPTQSRNFAGWSCTHPGVVHEKSIGLPNFSRKWKYDIRLVDVVVNTHKYYPGSFLGLDYGCIFTFREHTGPVDLNESSLMGSECDFPSSEKRES